MDQESQIIEKKNRFDKYIKILLNNKKSILSIFTIILLTILGYFFYVDSISKKKIKLADKYNFALLAYDTGEKKYIVSELKEIIMEKDKTYSPLALYFLIDNSLIESKKEINDFFDIVIEDSNLDKDIKDLVIYKKAIYNSDTESENNLLRILKPIINSESVWQSHAFMLMAEYFYSKGEKQKSKEFYQKILNLSNVNQNILLETQKRIRRDFSE